MEDQYIVRKIAIGCDHAGYILKETLKQYLMDELKLQVKDFGCNSLESCDYPDFAAKVAFAVQQDSNNTFGLVVCGSGIGVSQSCNKVKNIRCAICHDYFTAKQARELLDCNIIAFGERIIGREVANQALKCFLQTKFNDSEENKQNLQKLKELENENLYQNENQQ